MSVFPYTYVAEVHVWNGTSEDVLYYANRPFATQPTDTPASTICPPRLLQPALMQRDAFDTQKTSGPSRVSVGDCILANDGDGSLDFLLDGTHAVDGRTLVIRRASKLDAAYPAGFRTVFSGTMAYVTGDATSVTIKMRDSQQLVAVPFQPTKFAGSNVLPNGLEGTSELTGKPKPVTLGVVKNISPPCVNTSKLIYQVSDGAIASVDAVRDRGALLGVGSSFAATILSSALHNVAFGGGVFIVVGYHGVYSSADLVTWTARTAPTAEYWVARFLNSQFLIGGDAGTIATSPDGVTWTGRTNPVSASDTLRGFAFGNSIYVACSTNNAGTGLLTSPDGVTWTAGAAPLGGAIPYDVCYGDQFVMVGTAGAIATSPDGVTWTARASGVTTNLRSVCAGNGLYVAVGENGVILTSSDGIAWTLRPCNTTDTLTAALYTNGTFLVGAQSSIYASSDAATWTRQNIGAVVSGVTGWATGNGRVIASGNGNYVLANVPPTPYTSQADLLDDTKAPVPGAWGYYSGASGSYFRLGSTPSGTVTCDVTQGAATANRTAAQLYTQVLQRAGLTSANWSAADITALDLACGAEQGCYVDSETTCNAVLDQLAASVWAWWGADKTGTFRIQQLALPSGTPVVSWVRDDLIQPLTPVPSTDAGNGVPTYQSILQYGQNYTVQTSDIAGAVDAPTRAALAQEWQSVTATGAGVQTAHPLAVQTSEPSCFALVSDAQTEVTRRQTIRGTTRRWFQTKVDWSDANDAIDIGSVVKHTQARYGLASGVLFRVMGIIPDAKESSLQCLLWGG